MVERFLTHFAARDWDAMTEVLVDDTSTDDRRPLVGVGIRRGTDVVIADWQATAEIGVRHVTQTVIATRAERLVLSRYRFFGRDQRPEAFHTEVLGLAEIDTGERMAACVLFDVDDIDAALAELDARYLAGEAAASTQTWSVIIRANAAFNRRELPAGTPDWVNIDHRRGAHSRQANCLHTSVPHGISPQRRTSTSKPCTG